jgi:hypothetical protein
VHRGDVGRLGVGARVASTRSALDLGVVALLLTGHDPLLFWPVFWACLLACGLGGHWHHLDLTYGADHAEAAHNRVGVLTAARRWSQQRAIARDGWIQDGRLIVGRDVKGMPVSIPIGCINALAQEHRARAGELGADRARLSERPYSLAAGDEVIFTAAFYPPGERRVENGTLAEVTSVDGRSEIAVQTRGAHEQKVHVDTAEFNDVRLAYAQHVYKAQGATVDRAFVLTGGWQADRERAYVALSRARERSDIYVSREDLGEQGMDTGAIERLGEAIYEHHHPASRTPPCARHRAGVGDRAGADRRAGAGCRR